MYGVLSYFLIRVMISLLTYCLYPVTVTICVVWFLGLPSLTINFILLLYLKMALIGYVGCALGLSIGALFPTGTSAISINTLVLLVFSFGAGMYANTSSAANFVVKALSFVSPLKYGGELILRSLLSEKPEEFTD
jgi:hypothetical protein